LLIAAAIGQETIGLNSGRSLQSRPLNVTRGDSLLDVPDDALTELAKLDPQQERIIELGSGNRPN
jgi:hypothetical protein